MTKQASGGTLFGGKKQIWGVDYEVHLSDELDDVDKEKFYDYFEGTAQKYIGAAQEDEAAGTSPAVKYIFKDGYPYSFYQGWIVEDYQPEFSIMREVGDSPYEVIYLGSAEPGGGTTALAEAICDSFSKGATGLFLHSDPAAKGFYRRMGMHQANPYSNLFYYTGEELSLIFEEFSMKDVQ